MMLRVTVIPTTPRTFKIEGRIAGTAVEELRRLCDESLPDTAPANLILDLADVSFLDHEGIELIRHLRRRDVGLANYSPFLAELLKEVVPCS